MSHALITGIRGFTGKYVAETLSKAGYAVTGTYFSTTDVSSDNQRSLNICDFDDCRSCIEELRPSHIVHLAAKSFVGDTDNIGFYNVNVCISGYDLEVKINPAFVRDNEIKLLLGDSFKLRSLAPHANAINLESTIKWMMQA